MNPEIDSGRSLKALGSLVAGKIYDEPLKQICMLALSQIVIENYN